MSLSEIELELERLEPAELRELALKSWSAFVAREQSAKPAIECDEDDPTLLRALDEAMAQADAHPGAGMTSMQLRARLPGWSTR
jgi:hypothetical protein